MARNVKTEEDTTVTSAPKKRKFGVNTKNIPTALQTITPGWYIGHLKNVKADAADKQMAAWNEVEDKQLFDVIEVITGKKNERVHTGEYILVGAIIYSVELTNSEEQPLPYDTMSIMGGRCNIIFDKDDEGNWCISDKGDQYGAFNRTWAALQKATGLTQEDLDFVAEAIEFDVDEEYPVPERLEHVPDIQDMLQACMYYKLFFTKLAELINGRPVKVNVGQRNKGDGTDDLLNEINTGNFNSSCGLLPIEEE